MIKTLDRKLCKIFSEYIRKRDSENGYCRCITCRSVRHWKEVDAGHFMNRDRKNTRFNEKNVNAQCISCNRFKSGLQYEHGQAIDKKHGKGTANDLTLKSKIPLKMSAFHYKELIEKYKKKLKEVG